MSSDALIPAFNNPQLLEQALRHRSAGKPHNERLEFLGDSILGFVVSSLLYQSFPNASEGDLTHARSILVREPMLASIARENNLGDLLQLGPGEMKTGGHRRDSILADTLEAIIAAVYLDAGLEACQLLVEQWFGDRLKTISVKSVSKDPKTRLQEWLQSKQHALPDYQLIQAQGSDHERVFEVQCKLHQLNIQTIGNGSSVKSAEADAAQKALIQLGQCK
ncbi:MAG TPA: ribonuclease III [Arenimonas sp.]|nr:ribonuclease III [Arenimonas sp.]